MKLSSPYSLKRICTAILCIAALQPGAAQDWTFGIPLAVDGGLNFAKLDDQGLGLIQLPGGAAAIRSGFTATYADRVRVGAELGGFFNAYAFQKSNSLYSIAVVNPRAQINLGYLTKNINRHGTRLFFGIGGGTTFWSSDAESATLPDFAVTTSKSSRTVYFLNPEIGLSRIMRNGEMDILLTYQAHLGNAQNVNMTFTSDTGGATASTAANYLGLRVRYIFNVMDKTPENPYTSPPPQNMLADFDNRSTEDLSKVKTNSAKVKIVLFDNADVDGDTISLALNGRFLLNGHALTKEKKKVKFRLNPGENIIDIYAHNEGSISPNTATCILKTGLKKEHLLVTTSMKRNQRVVVVLD